MNILRRKKLIGDWLEEAFESWFDGLSYLITDDLISFYTFFTIIFAECFYLWAFHETEVASHPLKIVILISKLFTNKIFWGFSQFVVLGGPFIAFFEDDMATCNVFELAYDVTGQVEYLSYFCFNNILLIFLRYDKMTLI